MCDECVTWVCVNVYMCEGACENASMFVGVNLGTRA